MENDMWKIRTILMVLSVMVSCGAWADSWPSFRGPRGDGHAEESSKGLPTEWSETKNVAWKIPIPHIGWSTPVVMDGQVWITTATEGGNDFYGMGIDAESGEIFYNELLFHSDNPEPLSNAVNGYASPSATIEAGRVYLNFGSYGTACIDTKTLKTLWTREDLECRHYRGPGSSLILFENLLIGTYDGVDQQYIIALDKATGKTVWKTNRSTVWTDMDENGIPFMDGDRRKGFSTPIVHEVNGLHVLVNQGSSAIFGYDVRTGKEIWMVENPGHTASTSPVISDDLAIIATGAGATELRGIKLDGTGNVTESHIAWAQTGRWLPNTPSPIAVDGLVYTISDRGIATCVDAKNGAEIWTERTGGNYQASPIYADGKIYIISLQGKATVLEAGRAYKELAVNQLDDGCMASPVIAGKALYIRTKTHLYRVYKA
jgi:outer membrane protein assembly factor BamB